MIHDLEDDTVGTQLEIFFTDDVCNLCFCRFYLLLKYVSSVNNRPITECNDDNYDDKSGGDAGSGNVHLE